jgi:hypothetical protein
MKMDLSVEGLHETIQAMAALPGVQKRVRRDAMRFVVNPLRKKISRRAQQEWGEVGKGVKSRVYKDTGRGIVQVEYANRLPNKQKNRYVRAKIASMLENGRTTRVSPAMRKALHRKGFHLRKGTKILRVKARPVFAPVWAKEKSNVLHRYQKRYFVRLRQIYRSRFRRALKN